FAENEEIFYIAYVSEQNLLIDDSNKPCNHPGIKEIFESFNGSSYKPHNKAKN
ncbi:hemimethylated DNA-binding YccV-like domain-containing protein, partial [Gammaproteobacteria bacterium]|nr:hemimethylated DNA-binding YccV-like domain-containing protein [Gammaproteobacteria bacterium]